MADIGLFMSFGTFVGKLELSNSRLPSFPRFPCKNIGDSSDSSVSTENNMKSFS